MDVQHLGAMQSVQVRGLYSPLLHDVRSYPEWIQPRDVNIDKINYQLLSLGIG